MSYHNGPRIVTNGLVLCLDAGNSKSYPGSGTVWNDLSGNGYNATLTNGPSYSSLNKGELIFDGINDYATRLNTGIAINNAASISVWVKHTNVSPTIQRYFTIGTERLVVRKNDNNTFYFYANIASNNSSYNFKILSIPLSYSSAVNQILNFVATWDGSTMRAYKNGILAGSLSFSGSINQTTDVDYNVSFNSEAMNGSIYNILLYGRALSANEVSQNYNALKGRYNL